MFIYAALASKGIFRNLFRLLHMRKGFKIFLITLLVLVSILGTLFIYVYQNIDQLKKYAITEVNAMLKAELKAESIDVTVFKTFPKVSLALNQVSIADPLRSGKFLLKAQHVFLGFDVYDILNERYRIQLLEADSGELHLYTNKRGSNNYDLLKESSDKKSKKKPFEFQLNKLSLNRMLLSYEDFSASTFVQSHITSSSFSGSFTEKKFEMAIVLNGQCKELTQGTTKLLRNKKIDINSIMAVDLDKNTFKLVKGEFGVNQLKLQVSGSVRTEKKQTQYDIQFKAGKTSIQDLLSTLPVQLPASFLAYQSNGSVYFDGAIKGISSDTQVPSMNIGFGIENGSLLEPESKMKIEGIKLKGSFSNGAGKTMSTSVIDIPEMSANLAGSNVNGRLNLSNLEAPVLQMNVTGDGSLQNLHAFFKFEDVKEIKGDLKFTLSVKGEKKGENWDWSSPFNQGNFNLNMEQLTLNYLTKPIQQVNFQGNINNNKLEIGMAQLKIGQSDLTLNGAIPGFMDFVFGKDVQLSGALTCKSSVLDVNDLLIYDSSDPMEEGEKPMDYLLNLHVNADKFVYDKFLANQFKSDITLSPDKISFNQTSMATCGGTFTGKAEWIMANNQYILKSTNDAKGLKIEELFNEFNNFGQTEFTPDNLNGLLTAHTDLMIVWDSKMNLLGKKMVVLSDMTIKNGELKNYEPLSALSKFVDVNELKNLKFSELRNTLTIQNEVLNIPTMDIRNNAINLSLNGTHSFSNLLNYKIKLSLSELIQKRRKPQVDEFGEEDVKTRGINLYLTISGPLDKLQFKFDRKGAKAQLKQDVKQEKEAVKEILRQEFGVKKDSTLKKIEKKNDNNDELEFEPN